MLANGSLSPSKRVPTLRLTLPYISLPQDRLFPNRFFDAELKQLLKRVILGIPLRLSVT